MLAVTGVSASAMADAISARWRVVPCEPPATLYSASHDSSGTVPPCCPLHDATGRPVPSIGLCPGGERCTGTTCADGVTSCVPATDPRSDLPNIVLVTSDDQAYCHYGFMGSCRSRRLGMAIPAPYTPELDSLAARGKLFPVAHNAAPICAASLDTILTGRLPPLPGCGGTGAPCPPGSGDPTVVPTIPELLSPAGYCSYHAGKGDGATFDASFTSPSGLGRTRCTRCGADSWSAIDPLACQPDPANPDTNAPRCGEEIGDTQNSGDVDAFLQDLLVARGDGTYDLPRPFFLWYAPHLPHQPVRSSDVVEHRPHLSLPPDPSEPAYCRDFLFGFYCSPGPGGLVVGAPHFPFGAPLYEPAFITRREKKFQGVYGLVWQADHVVKTIEELLSRYVVHTRARPSGVTLADDTVLVYLSDNGYFIPRSKNRFTENGYRTVLLLFDPQSASSARLDTDLAHAVDILPTFLGYAGGYGSPLPAGLAGRDLRQADATHRLRTALCGPKVHGRSTTARYLLTNAAVAGRCAAAGVARVQACIDDADCAATETCASAGSTWCSNTRAGRAIACTSDADCRTTACKTCSKAESRTCEDDAGCGRWGSCVPAASALACRCDRLATKLYVGESGDVATTDLLRDPDETRIADGSAAADATDAARSAHLAHRMRCCLDRWWQPAGVPAEPNCVRDFGGDGCDSRLDCRS